MKGGSREKDKFVLLAIKPYERLQLIQWFVTDIEIDRIWMELDRKTRN